MSNGLEERRALVGLVRVRPAEGVLIPPGPGDAGVQKPAGAFPALARVGGLGPNEDNPLAGTWQVAFLGETEPRAARPLGASLRVRQLGAAGPAAVNGKGDRVAIARAVTSMFSLRSDRLSQDILDVRSADDELKGPLEPLDRAQTVKLRSSTLMRISEFPRACLKLRLATAT
jgi:hypothetical protein